MTVAFLAQVKIKLWDLGLCAWSHCINRKALIIQPWGREQSSMEEVWLPISFVWGLFLIKSIDRLQLHSSTLFFMRAKELYGGENWNSVQQTVFWVKCWNCFRVYEDWRYSICFLVSMLTMSPLHPFATSNAEKSERCRRDEDWSTNILPNENHLLPSLSFAYVSSLLHAPQLWQQTNWFWNSLWTKLLFKITVKSYSDNSCWCVVDVNNVYLLYCM